MINDLDNSIQNTNVKEIYEVISKHFSNSRVYTWTWIEEFIKSFPIKSNILDIGCGNGRNMQFNDYNFIGLDNCRGFLNICREKKLNIIECDMTNIPFRNNSFDAIICIASFHHLSNLENRLQSLREMKRLIKTSGKIMISVWSINQPLKTKKTFNKYGNTIVTYNKFGEIYERYYYIFQIDEIKNLFHLIGLLVIKHFYDCGNEIFILTK